MILLTLVGSFMAFTGIILHAISRLIDQSIRRLEVSRPRRPVPQTFSSEGVKYERRSGARNPARDN